MAIREDTRVQRCFSFTAASALAAALVLAGCQKAEAPAASSPATAEKPVTPAAEPAQCSAFAGQSAKSDVSSAFLQPFVSYTFKNTTAIGVNTESTFDFETSTWTTPINFTVGKLYRFGKQPVNLTIGAKYYATGPAGAPEWGLRFVTTFLFPVKH